MLKASRCVALIRAKRMAAARRVGTRICEARPAQPPLGRRERIPSCLLIICDEGPCLRERRSLSAIAERPIRTESVRGASHQRRLALAAQAVPIERGDGPIADEPHVLLAPIAVTDDMASDRCHSLTGACSKLV